MKKPFLILAFAALSLIAFLPIKPVMASQKFSIQLTQGHHHRHQQEVATIHYGASTFYRYPDGRLLAPHYNHQTVRDFARLSHTLGHRNVELIPVGQYGAIPTHLRSYAHQELSRTGIQVYDNSYHRHQHHHRHHHRHKVDSRTRKRQEIEDFLQLFF